MKRNRSTVLLLALALLGLSACSSTCHKGPFSELTPEPGTPIDPPDKLADLAMRHFLDETKAPAATTYDLTRQDLNGDGMREALMMVKSPYGYWCGTHGCTVLVFQAFEDHFTLVNGIQPVREPVFISNDKTNGWKNLVMRVSGRWNESKDVALQFNGKQYPDNPDALPPYLRLASAQDVRIFYEY